jgi:hypothetical protein
MTLIFFSLVGCGRIDHTVGPVDITVTHTLDVDQIRQYFVAECQTQFPYYTQEQIDICADSKIATLLSNLANQQ